MNKVRALVRTIYLLFKVMLEEKSVEKLFNLYQENKLFEIKEVAVKTVAQEPKGKISDEKRIIRSQIDGGCTKLKTVRPFLPRVKVEYERKRTVHVWKVSQLPQDVVAMLTDVKMYPHVSTFSSNCNKPLIQIEGVEKVYDYPPAMLKLVSVMKAYNAVKPSFTTKLKQKVSEDTVITKQEAIRQLILSKDPEILGVLDELYPSIEQQVNNLREENTQPNVVIKGKKVKKSKVEEIN